MAITLQGSDGTGAPVSNIDIDGSGNNFVYSVCRLVASGNYPGSPGDNVDLTPFAGLVPSGAVPVSAYVEGNGSATSQGGNGGYYTFTIGNALNNNKLRAWSAGGSEIATSAYPAAVTGDVITLNITWRKLRNY